MSQYKLKKVKCASLTPMYAILRDGKEILLFSKRTNAEEVIKIINADVRGVRYGWG